LINEIRPAQATLVPDPPNVLTSNAGWDTKKHQILLTELCSKLKGMGVRSAIFVDTNLENIEFAAKCGVDRIELYTGPFADEFEINKEKAMLYGVAPQQIAYTMHRALSNSPITNLYDENAVNQVGLVLSLDEKEKSTISDISQLKVKSEQGNMVPVADLVEIKETIAAKSIYRKNQKRVVYVMADMAGELESPAYAILGMEE